MIARIVGPFIGLGLCFIFIYFTTISLVNSYEKFQIQQFKAQCSHYNGTFSQDEIGNLYCD